MKNLLYLVGLVAIVAIAIAVMRNDEADVVVVPDITETTEEDVMMEDDMTEEDMMIEEVMEEEEMTADDSAVMETETETETSVEADSNL
jgi:beta-lactam-binding protein with PASTA domain